MSNHEDFVHLAVFGPGFGGSIVMYIPAIGWGVIDSCLVKSGGTTQNPALEYLKQKNVSQLAFVVLTHPHQDHYDGLDCIIDAYLGRIERVCFYSGDGLREYRNYLAKTSLLGWPGLKKLAKVFKSFEDAKKNGAQVVRLSERTALIRQGAYGQHEIEITALSPSAESVRLYTEILFRAIPKEKGDTIQAIPDKHHNLLSSAMFCQVGQLRLILGSDLEIGSTQQTGWRGVLASKDLPEVSAHIIKVPHHGSENAFHEPAWKQFSQKAPLFSIITPYNKATPPLPREGSVHAIAKYSSTIAITSTVKLLKPKKIYDRAIVKHLHGVKSWKCLTEPDRPGYVTLDVSPVDGSIQHLEILEPAYLWN